MVGYEIPALDAAAMEQTRAWLNGLVKPVGSLGRLEEIAIRLAGITGQVHSTPGRNRVVVFAADNGVHAQGITPVPQAVTAIQTANMTRGVCGINVLSRHAGSELVVVDVGVATDAPIPGTVNRRIRPGTADIARGPAMTRDEAMRAMEAGTQMARAAADEGVCLLGAGEMGICNTTTSSAMLSSFTGLPVPQITGRGAGIDSEGLRRKIAVIEEALRINRPDPSDPLDVLSKVGGLDIAAMAGLYLGAAERRIPVVVDGFISAIAALTAVRIDGRARDYLFASHSSQEPGYVPTIRELQLAPSLTLDMRLGEGTGCPLMFFVIEAAMRLCNEMATFEQGAIDNSGFVDIREDGAPD